MSYQSKLVLSLAGGIALCAGAAVAQKTDNNVRMNQIQVIGTHNSYHAGFGPSMAKLWQKQNPKSFRGLDYRHPPLPDQLSAGVRQIELDIYADSKGGLYAHPAGIRLVAQAGLPADPDPQHVMDKPGFKVMHMQDLDYRSNCQPFTECLEEVRTWSHAHPRHLPIFILIETKQSPLKNLNFPTVQPEKFTPAVFDELDREIESVFPRSEMIVPDQVRGKHATLDEAVRTSGWPTLATARGKVVFLMDQKDMGPAYLEGHPALKGRILFTNADPNTPDAAFMEQNDGSPAVIADLVRQGYLVRTRSDEPGEQALTNDTTRRDVALASGAQIVSTDYPLSERASTGYFVGLPDNLVARCNPVLKPKGCVDALLEPRN